jgi:hypothetical protein
MGKKKKKGDDADGLHVPLSRVWTSNNEPQEVLGLLSKKVPIDKLRTAFRKQCLAYHPKLQLAGDRARKSPSHEKEFQERIVAYRILLKDNPQWILSDPWDWKPVDLFGTLQCLQDEETPNGRMRVSGLCATRIHFTETAQDPGCLPHTNYVIGVNYCLRQHVVRRRYTEFRDLHISLSKSCPLIPVFPEKSLMLKLGLAAETERARELNTYIQLTIKSMKNRGRFSVRMLTFLGIHPERVRCEEEVRIVTELDTLADNTSTEWYMVNEKWLSGWRDYVCGHVTTCPGPIPNHELLTENGMSARRGLEPAKHYRAVNRDVWAFYQEVYGGGPPIYRRGPNIEAPKAANDNIAVTMIQRYTRGHLSRRHTKQEQMQLLMLDDKYINAMDRKRLEEQYSTVYDKVFSRQQAREMQNKHERHGNEEEEDIFGNRAGAREASGLISMARPMSWKVDTEGGDKTGGANLMPHENPQHVFTENRDEFTQGDAVQEVMNYRGGPREELFRLPGEKFGGKPLPSDFATMAGCKVLAPVTKIGLSDADRDQMDGQAADLSELVTHWKSGVFGLDQQGEPVRVDDMFAEFVLLMGRGVVVLKYPSSGKGAPKKKVMKMDEKISTLEWTTNKPLKRGKRYGLLLCEVLRVSESSKKNGRRFTLQLPTRKLDMEATSTDEYELLVWGFRQMLRRRSIPMGPVGKHQLPMQTQKPKTPPAVPESRQLGRLVSERRVSLAHRTY